MKLNATTGQFEVLHDALYHYKTTDKELRDIAGKLLNQLIMDNFPKI